MLWDTDWINTGFTVCLVNDTLFIEPILKTMFTTFYQVTQPSDTVFPIRWIFFFSPKYHICPNYHTVHLVFFVFLFVFFFLKSQKTCGKHLYLPTMGAL